MTAVDALPASCRAKACGQLPEWWLQIFFVMQATRKQGSGHYPPSLLGGPHPAGLSMNNEKV